MKIFSCSLGLSRFAMGRVGMVFYSIAVLAFVPPPSDLRAGDWPGWLGPSGDGVSDEALPKNFDPEAILWTAKVGVGYSSLAVSKGRVFTLGHVTGDDGSGREVLWCLEAESGEVIWSQSWEATLMDNLHEGGPSGTPLVDGGSVYAVGKAGALIACDLEDGAVLWRRDLLADTGMKSPPEWGFAASPVKVGDLLVVEAGMTLGLNPKSGEIQWRSQPFRPAYGSPAVMQGESGELRLAVLKTDGLAVLDAETGGTLAFEPWETPFDTNATTPIVKGNSLFVSTGYDRGCALFQFDGRRLVKRYENRSLCNHMSHSVLMGGYLFGFDGTAHRGRPTEFVCLEFEGGGERWRVSPEQGLGCGSLIATREGKLLILTERGELVVAEASPDAFRIESRGQVLGGRCWTPPVLSFGRLYARNSRGDLVCVGGE